MLRNICRLSRHLMENVFIFFISESPLYVKIILTVCVNVNIVIKKCYTNKILLIQFMVIMYMSHVQQNSPNETLSADVYTAIKICQKVSL